MVLADVKYADAEIAHIEFRKSSPGIYFEPGHIVQQIALARARHREIYGIHPEPPAGKRWAISAIDDPLELES